MKTLNILTAALFYASTTMGIGTGNEISGETKGNDTKNSKISSKSSFTALTISGKVINLDEDMNLPKIILFNENEKVLELTADALGEFTLDLESNKYYVLEVTSEDHLPKRLVFNTDMRRKSLKKQEFLFDLNLVHKDLVKESDHESLDFPYAVVSYDKENREFDYHKEYSISQMINEHSIIYSSGLRENITRIIKNRKIKRSMLK